MVKAACPLEGGGASGGSTCGVVSGGCMALALGHLADILEGDAAKTEALYGRMREYALWFEESFGSTLCRERCGTDLTRVTGFLDYIFTGKVFTRCVAHLGKSAKKLIEMVNRPLLEQRADTGRADTGPAEAGRVADAGSAGGYCAAEVLHGIREATGLGSEYLENISIAFDGGIGLSGGLCGALAGALLPLGMVWGIDPKEEGIAGTLRAFLRGHVNLYTGRGRKELWAAANPLVREFRREFGSLECRELTSRSFAGGEELATFVPSSPRCAEIKEWCRDRVVEILGYGSGG